MEEDFNFCIFLISKINFLVEKKKAFLWVNMLIEISLKSFLFNIIGMKEDIEANENVSIANVILI